MNRLLTICISLISVIAYSPHALSQPNEKDRVRIISTIAKDFHDAEQEKVANKNTVPDVGEFSPGKYEIDWEGVQLSQNDNVFCINVPITPQYRYQAHRINENGKKYVVDVMQRLIISKNKITGKMFEVIHTMIPSKKYSKSWYSSYVHPGLENKITSYSGIIAISNPNTGKTTQIITYIDGQWVDNISLSKGNSQYEENTKRMEKLFSTIDIIKIQ